MPEPISVYRERAHLVAFLSTLYPSVGAYNDPEYPGWLMVYIETPAGQMSWQISPEDVDLFDSLPICETYEWDGHSTEEKYKKLQNFTRLRRLPANMSEPTMTTRNNSRLDSLLLTYDSKQVAAALKG